MSQIEDIFVESDYSLTNSLNQPVQGNRVKMGEVFQLPNERYALACIHCTEEFEFFSEFTLHVQDHLQHFLQPIVSERIKKEIDDDGNGLQAKEQNITVEVPQIAHQSKEIPEEVNLLKTDQYYSDNDYNDFLDVRMDDDASDDDDVDNETKPIPSPFNLYRKKTSQKCKIK